MAFSSTRIERDSLGEVAIPSDRYWGAQTQRAVDNFGPAQPMPAQIIHALGRIKACAARANASLGVLDEKMAAVIAGVGDEIASGRWDAHFPLSVWQSGSGTQSNMNANEVIANRASELLGGARGTGRLVHPNDHCNRSQSSNDTFPTAMHLASVEAVHGHMLPALQMLQSQLAQKAEDWRDIVKTGRTHLMDATPLTLGQEFSGFASQVGACIRRMRAVAEELLTLPQGGTAVGTGVNSPPGFAQRFAEELTAATGHTFRAPDNTFYLSAAHDGLVALAAELATTAGALNKIANDVRLLASGPRCGLAELQLPANEPGSSIMPGKVNPTQCEALTMRCAQVMGNHHASALGGTQGHLQLNTFKPLIAFNIFWSIELLTDGIARFCKHAIIGAEPNEANIARHVEQSLMLVTALAPHVGYDRAADIAKHAASAGISLREAARAVADISDEDFDRWVNPRAMTRPG
jgi:fumarate hydratase class II